MPTLSQFYGIAIKMFFWEGEHGPPHFHAYYGEHEAEFSIRTGILLHGKLPPKVAKKVWQWWWLHRKELMEVWETQTFQKIEPLK